MAFLSRIALNPLRTHTQKLLNNPQAMHAAVLGGMPPGTTGRTLWREEVRRSERGAVEVSVLVQTPLEPDWAHLVEQAGWASAAGTPLIRSLDPLVGLIAVGRQFQFRVRANPVQNVRIGPPGEEHPRRGKRVGHRTAQHQLDWFFTRTSGEASAWGFELNHSDPPSAQLVGRDHVSFTKGAGTHRVTLDRATFTGQLVVTDAVTFRSSLLDGVGGAKAYGCALLTLAPGSSHVVAG